MKPTPKWDEPAQQPKIIPKIPRGRMDHGKY